MRRPNVFQIRNQVRKPKVGYYYLAAAALTAVVVGMVAIGSALGGEKPREEQMPLGAGPVIEGGAEAAAASTDAAFPYGDRAWFADADGLLTVVDRKTGLAKNFIPADLVRLQDYGIACQPETWTLRRIIIDDLTALFEAGRAAGHEYFVFSAYRSYATQAHLYAYWVKQLGEKEADRSSARAGHSEHQLGTTADISVKGIKGNVFDVFGETEAGNWLAANAWRFGFVMSYPKGREEESGYMYEPWHFRYVGREVAAIIREKDVVPSVFIRELAVYRSERERQF
jgi:LAS superfamily LD-carboxypeptidase LdcB